MSGGIRAEVQVAATGTCPVAEVARETGEPATSISRSSGSDGPAVEEFMLEWDREEPPSVETDLEPVFAYGPKTVYRFRREPGRECPCQVVEQFGAPIADVHARDGTVHLVFHADGMTELRGVIGRLQDRYRAVDVQRLLRSGDDSPEHNLVFVDRGRLTERQCEVLRTAHRMGYFEHPKGANATEVAAELDISPSTFAEHLAAAQSKLMEAILDA
ncbi:MAG: helix-turn-helix domain-containing protein [Halobacteriales archaeon]